MPVTFDNGAGVNTGGGLANTLQVTLTAATNACLLVFAGNNNGTTASVSAVAYGGVPLTRLGSVHSTGANMFEVWGLTAPAAGSNILSARFALTSVWLMAGVTYLNVADTGPFSAAMSGTSGTASNTNWSFSSTSTELFVCGFLINNAGQNLTINNATTRVSSETVAGNCQMVVGDLPGAAPETVSCTTSFGNSWKYLGVSLRFSATAAGSRLIMNLGLTGAGI